MSSIKARTFAWDVWVQHLQWRRHQESIYLHNEVNWRNWVGVCLLFLLYAMLMFAWVFLTVLMIWLSVRKWGIKPVESGVWIFAATVMIAGMLIWTAAFLILARRSLTVYVLEIKPGSIHISRESAVSRLKQTVILSLGSDVEVALLPESKKEVAGETLKLWFSDEAIEAAVALLDDSSCVQFRAEWHRIINTPLLDKERWDLERRRHRMY